MPRVSVASTPARFSPGPANAAAALAIRPTSSATLMRPEYGRGGLRTHTSRARAVRAARPDLRPLCQSALVRPGPALAFVPRLANPARRRSSARRRNRNRCSRHRAGAHEAGPRGGRRRSEPGDARGRTRPRCARRPERTDRAARRTSRGAAVRGRGVRCGHLHLPAALRRRRALDDARAGPGRSARRDGGDARVRTAARRVAAALGALRASRAAGGGSGRVAELGRRGPLPRPEHPRLLARLAGAAPLRHLARGRSRRGGSSAAQSRRRNRRLGEADVTEARPRPAFYALRSGGWRDYVTLLHPPYTLWHLSYVAVGAALVPHMDWTLLGWTALAFALAMGVGAHALDELNGRPLQTRISSRMLVALAAT